MRTIYKLLDAESNVLHIGETCNMHVRLQKHKRSKFPNAVNIVELESGDWTRKESWHAQLFWQKEYGFETDDEKRIKNAKIVTEKKLNHLKRIAKKGTDAVIKKYGNDHFKRMQEKASGKGAATTLAMRVTCPICNSFTGAPPHVGNHKKKCKG